jgi:hypothetical protein
MNSSHPFRILPLVEGYVASVLFEANYFSFVIQLPAVGQYTTFSYGFSFHEKYSTYQLRVKSNISGISIRS